MFLQPLLSSSTTIARRGRTQPLDTTGKSPGLLFVCKIPNKIPETICALRALMALESLIAVEKTSILLKVLSYQ